MTTIHIRATEDTEDIIISELMNVLNKYKFKTEKYLGTNSKIVMAKKDNFSPTEISLCGGCNCATHTLDDGKCGKCGFYKVKKKHLEVLFG